MSLLPILLIIVVLPLVTVLAWFTIQGAPFVATRDEDVAVILRLLRLRKGQKAVDIGSGDGELVIALAKKGLQVDGYEINPWLVYLSKRRIRKEKLTKAHIYWKSIWKADFSAYDIVTVYAIQHIMGRLEDKLKKELPKGSIVASNYFTFPHWNPLKKEGRITLYKKT